MDVTDYFSALESLDPPDRTAPETGEKPEYAMARILSECAVCDRTLLDAATAIWNYSAPGSKSRTGVINGIEFTWTFLARSIIEMRFGFVKRLDVYRSLGGI